MKSARNSARLLFLAGLMSQPLPMRRTTKTHLPIRDLASIEGVRENPLIGYGMVVGLAGTGDRRQTMFSTQTLANILQKMGVQIPAAAVSVKNVAAVFVTASLPPFARPGTQIDVTVSSIGDATSLEGGTLLLAPLYAADGQVYAEAQGAVTLGGYTAGKRHQLQAGESPHRRTDSQWRTGGAGCLDRLAQAGEDCAAGARSRLPHHQRHGGGHQSGNGASGGDGDR